ncbi:sigma-70 family RNA polymerase sigma factor [Kutzneria buriramensis]|uniref:RNA polymerase sigma-70 factor (ECF subfamily) n=1 Tax=Kutzneria buriramensis TaxID=1045776 RepID=A0A3E0GX51_9PSEU|nr:sigma-70 family RNA polymerase sigma factor [Kutzneria buriramensis]REH29422.1 RNA polymerase sigma-70 factor (ECF subfamily) [Kutzneria buriramensis]
MPDDNLLAERFEAHRPLLRAVAGRMLGSTAEADDAVQETWLRLSKADGVDNLESWLRTVVSRISLDMLRSRKAKREEPIDWHPPAEVDGPEREAVLVDEVGRAMLVVLDRLAPAERVAFVLHDMFAVPFDEIASVVDRTPVTTKKLASRARQKVRGAETLTTPNDTQVVEAFLQASREGDLEALLAILAPDVMRRADAAALPKGRSTVVRGRDAVAREMLVLGKRARFAEPALVNGKSGAVVAPNGQLRLVLVITIVNRLVSGYEVIADPECLETVDIAVP